MRTLIFLFILFWFGCTNQHFMIYTIDGEPLYNNSKYKSNNFNSGIELYFDRNDIKKNFQESHIIATDNFFYGQFFFDKIFMSILKEKVNSLNADAVIHEKDRIDFPNYNEDFIYFTVIKFKVDKE